MGTEYTAKSFKSGNSVAIRIPAALGVEPDREWSVELRDGDLVLHPKEKSRRKFNIEKVWGSATNLKPIDPDDRWFEERLPDRSDTIGNGPA
jgi:antitoxin VapB